MISNTIYIYILLLLTFVSYMNNMVTVVSADVI